MENSKWFIDLNKPLSHIWRKREKNRKDIKCQHQTKVTEYWQILQSMRACAITPRKGKTITIFTKEKLTVPQLSTWNMLHAAVAAKTKYGMVAEVVMKAGLSPLLFFIKEEDCIPN